MFVSSVSQIKFICYDKKTAQQLKVQFIIITEMQHGVTTHKQKHYAM